MDKLTSRPSGGGGKLCTLDMQSYLEVMGRQLAEIQAQHQQFYASRPERHHRATALRNQEHGQGMQLATSALSESSVSKHLDGQTPGVSEGPGHNVQGHSQLRTPAGCDSSGASGADGGPIRSSQGGARRLLSFPDDPVDQPNVSDLTQSAGRRLANQSPTYTSDSSPVGPYTVYEVSGGGSASCLAGGAMGVDHPIHASISSSSQGTWRSSGPDNGDTSTASKPAGTQGTADAVTPSTASGASPAVAAYSAASTVGEESVSGSPCPLAIAGRAYDGIDSEEDEELLLSSIDNCSTAAASGTAAISAAKHGGGRPQRAASQATPGGMMGASRPALTPGGRAPLVAASLETEEALRLLLGTPRCVAGAFRGSVDAEGLDVPDDVLAALARTDGHGLDAVLGAAKTPNSRPPGASTPEVPSSSGRSRAPGQGNDGQALPSAHGRHPKLGPGALTADPVAPPAGLAARGYEAGLRGGGHGTSRGSGATGLPPRGSPLQRQGGVQQEVSVNASIDVGQVDLLSQTIVVEAGGLSDAALRGSVALAAAAIAAQRAAAQQPGPVLYSRSPLSAPAGTCSHADATEEASGEVDGGQAVRALASPGGLTNVSLGPSTAGYDADSSPGSALPGRGPGQAVANAQPGPVGRGAAASPSVASAVRQAGDGDMVLYGSPSRKDMNAEAVSPISVAASPYVPPSPPPGADPAPYMASPIASHPVSRLQRSSRGLDGKGDATGAHGGDEPDTTESRYGLGTSAAGCTSSSSRRQFTGSAGNSASFDLSLTQAAAVGVSTSSKLLAGHASPALGAPASLSRQLPSHSVAQQQSPGTEQQHGLEQPMHSSFSVAALSPAGVSRETSHAWRVDERGQSGPPQPLELGATSQAAPIAQVGAVAPKDVPDRPVGWHQQQPIAPPLAAFSRAAALAAAADVGLQAPPATSERRAQPAVPSATPPGGTRRVRSATSGSPSLAMEQHPPRTVAGEAVGGDNNIGKGLQRRLGGAWTLHGGGAGHDGEAPQGHLHAREGGAAAAEEVAGSNQGPLRPTQLSQSPAPPSAASGSAKLSQLKARRQQQWQSQHSIRGHASEQLPPTTLGMAASRQSDHAASEAPPQDLDACSHDGRGQSAGHLSRYHSASSAWAEAPLGRPAGGNPDTVQAPGTHGLTPHQDLPPPPSAGAAPLLPGALAEAIVRAARADSGGGQQLAASGELSLGHGISGLSVAIEAGQVKWAWQTNKAHAGQVDASMASEESPWASPIADRGAAGHPEAGLPPPQWQRREEGPAAAHSGEHAEFSEPAMSSEPRRAQQPESYAAQRRHSEYSMPSGPGLPLPVTAAGAQQHKHAASIGGSLTQQPEQQDLRGAVSADVNGQATSKAAALLRLKRQSIMRHTALAGGVKEPDGQSTPRPMEQQRPGTATQQRPGTAALQRPATATQQRPATATQQRPATATQQRPGTASQQPPKLSVPAFAMPVTQHEEGAPSRRTPRGTGQQPDEGEAEGHDMDGPHVQPKPFLRRRSAKIPARKVDWSHVKPRTNSRNPDYYEHPSPRGHEVPAKAHVSPLPSPRGGVAKPPLSGRAWRPGGRQPQSPTDEEKAAAARRRVSNIPAAPGYAAPHQAATGATEGTRTRNASGAARGPGGGMSPLDDLLAHVNTLLRDFDKIVL
ncbi:hypothetical protein Agub_g1471 [Astrephomene gubernaculifera]|uniref:Uncharacterized protein n=1 Tax=Astrephomene gubernaculifera TaxID=47775 RepID=A0AAD3DGA6_9CHLO|nr:hypothetical protein Agub_g1471 [Astrephomene gubernaculifera]